VSVRIVREWPPEGGAEEPGISFLDDPAPVLVRADEELLFHLPADGAVVRGRVLSRRGAPVQEFELDFVRYRGLVPRSCESRIVRDSRGSFAEGLAEPGLWAVEVRAAGHAVHRTPPFMAGCGATVDLGDIELGFGGSVRGAVADAYGRPVEHARIHLLRVDWLMTADTPFTDRDGEFEMRGVPPGTYRLFVVSARHPLGVVRSLTVEPGATTRVEVRLPEAVRAVLRVTDESGRPIRGAEVHCIHPDLAPLNSRLLSAYEPPGWGPGETDAEGLVVKPYAPPVPVLVRVRAEGYASRAEVVTLAAPEFRSEVHLVRLAPGTKETIEETSADAPPAAPR
jgi:protocatechuate 3,4-dioxygenase beta subunit